MKKLTKTQETDRITHSADLFHAYTALEDTIIEYNEAIAAAKKAVETAVTTFNERLDAARAFCEQVVSDMDDYECDRSDRWMESDAASAFHDWKSEWESVDLEDLDVYFPEPIEIPDNPQDALNDLPSEASS